MPVPDPAAVLAAAVTLAYIVGTLRARRSRPRVVGSRSWCAVAGLATVAVATVGPFDGRAASSLGAHMAQHVVLMGVAAPLLAVSDIVPVVARGVPGPLGHVVLAARRRTVASATGAAWVRLVALALVLHVATLWAWHVPALYAAALRHDGVHLAEHLTLTGAATWLWWLVAGLRRREVHFGGLVAVFVSSLSAVALGAALTFAERPWYDLAPTVAHDLADQQLAGVVLWAFGGLAAVVAAMALVVSWLLAAERAERRVGGQGSAQWVSAGSPAPGSGPP